jgi:hypothetical protein
VRLVLEGKAKALLENYEKKCEHDFQPIMLASVFLRPVH